MLNHWRTFGVQLGAQAILAKATNDRETHEQIVARLAKPQRPKKAKDGTEQNRGFVERQFNKLKQDLKHLKKSPGIVQNDFDIIFAPFPPGRCRQRCHPRAPVRGRRCGV